MYLIAFLFVAVVAQQVDIDKQSWLDEHNARRTSEGSSNMNEIVWSNELESLALDWASRCYSSNRLPTSSRPASEQTTNSYAETGENIYWSTDIISAKMALDKWYGAEKALWDYPNNQCSADWTECVHYTQVVWASTCAIGCAQVECPNGDGFTNIVVCNYGPSGNIVTNTDTTNPIFEQIYLKGAACSQCTNGCSSSQTQLCQPTCQADAVTTVAPTTAASSTNAATTDASTVEQTTSTDITTGRPGGMSGVSKATTARTTIPPVSTCINTHDLCDFWAAAGECLHNHIWMLPNCCQSCTGTTSTSPKPGTDSGTCVDTHQLCPFWASANQCTNNAIWMLPNCCASCKATSGASCVDTHELCAFWASYGECTKNSAWMPSNCCASCSTSMSWNSGPGTNGSGSSSCFDTHEYCQFWAKAGECSNNAIWMQSNCCRSCSSFSQGTGWAKPIPDLTMGSGFKPNLCQPPAVSPY